MIEKIPEGFIPIKVLESELSICKFVIQSCNGIVYDMVLSVSLSNVIDWINSPRFQDRLKSCAFSVEKNSKFSVLKHGHWNVGYFHDRVCSFCCHPSNDLSEPAFNFCPWCGSKMDI